MLDWIREKLDGKKTYITAFIAAALAAAEVLGYTIPPYVFTILAALGLTALRAGVNK